MSAETAWIPFSLLSTGQLVTIGSLDGVAARVIFDTGAAGTLVSSDFARRLGLKGGQALTLQGLTGRATGQQVQLKSLTVGPLRVGELSAYIFDFSTFLDGRDSKADIVIGRTLLQKTPVDIDFSARRLRFPDQLQLSPESLPSPTRIRVGDDGRLYFKVSLEQNPPIDALFDLGSGLPLYVSPLYASDHLQMASRVSSLTATTGVEGVSVDIIATLRSLSLGGSLVPGVPMTVPKAWHQHTPALVGLPVLSRFRTVIDLPGERLWLIPDEKMISAPFTRDRSGIGAKYVGDCLQVVFVSPGSPASEVGLKIGDEIISVDGAAITPEFFLKRPRPGAEPAGTKELLTLSDGRQLKLVLHDYF